MLKTCFLCTRVSPRRFAKENEREGTRTRNNEEEEGRKEGNRQSLSLLSLKLASSIRPGKRTRPQNKGPRAYQGKFGPGSWVGANPYWQLRLNDIRLDLVGREKIPNRQKPAYFDTPADFTTWRD